MNLEAGHENERKARLAVLARAEGARLSDLWRAFGLKPDYRVIKGPDTGLVALRGRIGGGGEPFHFGEATLTRAVVRLASGELGFGQALGRDGAKVELAALIDACCQLPDHAVLIDDAIVTPLRAELDAEDQRKRDETTATRVDFFTLVRGED